MNAKGTSPAIARHAAGATRAWIATLVVASIATGIHAVRGDDDREALEQRAFRAAVERIAPSVVRIETLGGLADRAPLGRAATTGLAVSADGYVVSSAFGFLDRPDSILVQLYDGSRKVARLVATDHHRKLVLLKIEVDAPLPLPETAPPESIRVGQWALAVGRTFEADRPNVAVGIVSALDRIWGKALQTDAAVSPNNYGGPLVDVHGRLLGVIVPLSHEGSDDLAGAEWYDAGIGFAVPAEAIERVLPKLQRGEDVFAGQLGIGFAPGNLSTTEPVVATCLPRSPARRAGIAVGDRVVEIDGQRIIRASQVREQLGRRDAGETIRMAVMRDGERIERELELVAVLEPYEFPFLGVLPVREGGEREAGVEVRFVYPESPAARAGIARGDVLAALDARPVADAVELRRSIAEREPGDEVAIEVRRGDETLGIKVGLGRIPESVPPGPLPPARRADPNPAPDGGTIEMKIAEFKNNVWAYLPGGEGGTAHGMILWLAPPNRFDWKAILARWKAHCDRDGLILVAPEPADREGWRPGDVDLVGRLIDRVRADHGLDPTRIVLGGRQSGGRLACLAAFAHREPIRAVATVEAPLTGRPPASDPLYPLAFFTAWSKGSASARAIEAGVERLRAMKYPVTVRDLGPQDRDLSPGEIEELARWIDALDRI